MSPVTPPPPSPPPFPAHPLQRKKKKKRWKRECSAFCSVGPAVFQWRSTWATLKASWSRSWRWTAHWRRRRPANWARRTQSHILPCGPWCQSVLGGGGSEGGKTFVDVVGGVLRCLLFFSPDLESLGKMACFGSKKIGNFVIMINVNFVIMINVRAERGFRKKCGKWNYWWTKENTKFTEHETTHKQFLHATEQQLHWIQKGKNVGCWTINGKRGKKLFIELETAHKTACACNRAVTLLGSENNVGHWKRSLLNLKLLAKQLACATEYQFCGRKKDKQKGKEMVVDRWRQFGLNGRHRGGEVCAEQHTGAGQGQVALSAQRQEVQGARLCPQAHLQQACGEGGGGEKRGQFHMYLPSFSLPLWFFVCLCLSTCIQACKGTMTDLKNVKNLKDRWLAAFRTTYLPLVELDFFIFFHFVFIFFTI